MTSTLITLPAVDFQRFFGNFRDYFGLLSGQGGKLLTLSIISIGLYLYPYSLVFVWLASIFQIKLYLMDMKAKNHQEVINKLKESKSPGIAKRMQNLKQYKNVKAENLKTEKLVKTQLEDGGFLYTTKYV